MSVAIRLRREGTKNNPIYRVVAAHKRFRRDGRFLEILGTYTPTSKGKQVSLNLEKIDDWISKGAQPSDTVRQLIKKERAAAS